MTERIHVHFSVRNNFFLSPHFRSFLFITIFSFHWSRREEPDILFVRSFLRSFFSIKSTICDIFWLSQNQNGMVHHLSEVIVDRNLRASQLTNLLGCKQRYIIIEKILLYCQIFFFFRKKCR